METWNRQELYAEIWEQPLIKVAAKYGISAVALGKVCRKLQIPLPGRGYWTKKEFGKAVEKLPLQEAKDVPVVHRFKFPLPTDSANSSAAPPQALPTDVEYRRVVEFESRSLAVDPNAKWHRLVKETERILKRARPDDKGILHAPYDQLCLDVRVSKGSLERALTFMNTVILTLEAEGFAATIRQGKHGTGAQIFGHRVEFAVVEKLHEIGRREIKEYSWTRTVIDYEPIGQLEFRYGDYIYGRKYRDGKKQKLESLLQGCVASLMREGRAALMAAKLEEQRNIERATKERERADLARQIAEEERKVKDLETWVSNWAKAQQMREFISVLERVWSQEGHDLSPEAAKGQRIIWMKQQADRIDPMLQSPPSILDRKAELGPYW